MFKKPNKQREREREGEREREQFPDTSSHKSCLPRLRRMNLDGCADTGKGRATSTKDHDVYTTFGPNLPSCELIAHDTILVEADLKLCSTNSCNPHRYDISASYDPGLYRPGLLGSFEATSQDAAQQIAAQQIAHSICQMKVTWNMLLLAATCDRCSEEQACSDTLFQSATSSPSWHRLGFSCSPPHC